MTLKLSLSLCHRGTEPWKNAMSAGHKLGMMLNSGATPFEYFPHPPTCYYSSHCYQPPLLHHESNYYQPSFYYYFQSPPQLLSPHPNTATTDDLALQFSHLSLADHQPREQDLPPAATNNTSTTQVEVSSVPVDPPPPPPPPPPLRPSEQQQQLIRENSRVTVGCSTGTVNNIKYSPILEFDESNLDVEIRTTVMIKNIPNKLSRDLLITLLDQHCAEENYKAVIDGSPLSEYDFVYLPMDFVKGCNLGYAFVNLTAAVAGWRLYRAMHGLKWAIFSSHKTSHICYARIQGKEALVANFRRSCFVCRDEKYLPAVFSPPRNGTTSLTPPAPVGKRVGSFALCR